MGRQNILRFDDNLAVFQSGVSLNAIASHANAVFLIGTVKPLPVPAIRKSVPPEVSPNFQLCVVSLRPGFRDFCFVPSGRDWRSLET